MITTINNTMPWQFGQPPGNVFPKNRRLLELERRTARLEQYQTMQHAITQIIARSTELDEALPRIIETICEIFGWELGEVWYADHEAGVLFCVASLHLPSVAFPIFGKSGFGITFTPGKGLPGRVWASEKPAWISDVVLDRNFLRAPQAQRDGLHTGFGIPVRSEGEIIGVMTFFSRQILKTDHDLLCVLETIGSQIGLFIERKRIEFAEREQARKLAALEERQRLARDLHDSVTQTLFSASVMAEMLPQIWSRSPEQARAGLDELHQLTRSALVEMRTLLLELRSAESPYSNVTDRLTDLVDSVRSRRKLDVTLEVHQEGLLTSDEQLTLYRIAQEALTNVVKHARATRVSIELSVDQEHLELHICDNGRGFLMGCQREGHFGLNIMRERAQEIGARFDLKSLPGKGTFLIVSR